MLRFLPLFCFTWLLPAISKAGDAYTFDYNPACAAAYHAYLSLHVPEGDALIARELAAHPYNLTATYIADYGDAITLLFNGDPYQLQQRQAHEDERIARLEKGDDASPWKRLALSGVYLHWSLIHIWEGRQLKAATGLRRSYLLLRDNATRFPAFAPDDGLYGAEEALAGIIPDSYKWIANVLGMKGSLANGLARLSTFLRRNGAPESPLREEALLYDYFLRFHFGGDKPGVWKAVSSDAAFPIAANPMRAFLRANLALAYRHADAAIAALRTDDVQIAARAWPILHFELGSALLLRQDAASIGYFNRFLAANKGKPYVKDALQQAAFAAYLAGQSAQAAAYRTRILSEGNTFTDADRQAQRFAKGGNWPQLLLLRARLLIDGGYAAQALIKLRETSAAAFNEPADKVEYDFRLGRALEETGDAPAAVQAYQRAINAGRSRPEHFAARAALQMGGIYEARAQKAEAGRYYETALSMRDHDYQASIDQMAKAGLARVE